MNVDLSVEEKSILKGITTNRNTQQKEALFHII
jgi:hypothetical protein